MFFDGTPKAQIISLNEAILEIRTSIRLTTLQFSITTLQFLLKLYHEKWLVLVEYKLLHDYKTQYCQG
jgi:hypothetical protein